tara:strand:- start:378 stop:623 length:246 start_codon:yes stop_codon:yes gene_type:complete
MNTPFKMKGFKGFYTKAKTKVKRKLNESTFTNPKSLDERLNDQMDSRMRTSYMKEGDLKNPMYKDLTKKSKKTRPNRKNRY